MEAARVLAETADSEPVIEDWLMKRNCSVSPRQFVLFYASLAGLSPAIAALLLWIGVWLAMPLPGTASLAVGIEFAITPRHSAALGRTGQ
ncbi:DUF2244 domain-containing protein, partial [Burkholderia cenocepacia]|uniref:DUF2244 domain-containing protein n=1 Tax=Burkholderia cenocepacia TaxID=95486 RepID=UPI00406C19CA